MHKRKFIGIFIIAMSLGLIAYQATRNESSVTFFTPEEIFANPQQFAKKTFRVSGFVLEGSKVWDRSTQTLTFRMTDFHDHTFLVSYKGTPPDLFKEKQGVIVEGRLDDFLDVQSATQVSERSDAQYILTEAKKFDVLHLRANLLMVKHSEVYNTGEDHSQMREMKLRNSLFKE